MENEAFFLLWLSLLKGIGPVTAHKLLNQHMTAQNIFENKNEIGIIKKVPNMVLAYEEANKIVDLCDKQKIKLLTYGSEVYPSFWKEYDDFPIVLYTKGQKLDNIFHCVGIVGARRCTENGKQQAINICQKAIKEEYVVVSGMAKGVDSYAHTACIKNSGKTIAVLGNGVDICYPSEHKYLYDAICDSGMIISEYLPGIRPSRYNFPKRNRIIAGMSEKIYVIEAGHKSGTASTVDASIKYGKKVKFINCYGREENE